MAQPFQAPLDAIAATVAVSPVQSATIVSEISAKLERWIANKEPVTVVVPGMRDVSILQGGAVWWCRGQDVPASRVVWALGTLLASLLDHTAAHRAPAGLLYVAARATDPRHLAPFSDLGEFSKTIARYAAAQPLVAMDALVARFAVACSGLPPLGMESTISDVRRLRRAGGVPLSRIATDTAIPISLLRELEWGVYTHWNLEHARGALELYAERAGLDVQAVARVIEHEQALTLAGEETPQSVRIAVNLPDRTPRRSALPFALATLLIGAILLAAPGDRPPRVVAAPTVAREASAPIHIAPVVPASDHPATHVSPRKVTPADNSLPRRNRAAMSTTRRRPPAPSDGHPLLKLARAIVGSGQYRVEPFPRVKK